MVHPEIIRKKLNKLDEYLAILANAQKYSYEEFISNPEHYGSVERFLHLAIESVTDMGNHVVAELSLGQVEWYSDIPKILMQDGYITSELMDKWIRMIGFRNTLVHEYIEIDRKIVYDVLQHSLSDLQAFKKVFAQFL
jgi:uncharacterized protein YutE (UPF0331/DUF86 family)